jgi:hypothetical protein
MRDDKGELEDAQIKQKLIDITPKQQDLQYPVESNSDPDSDAVTVSQHKS